MASKRIGVVLSGCGVYDGAEIHEATLTLYFLDRAGVRIIAMAPDVEQHHVINHLTGEVTQEKRNVLVESARIARGEIRDLALVHESDLDAILLPGGFGAAKNLSTVAFEGANAQVNPHLTRLLGDMYKAGKPIGAMCISPAVLSKALANQNLTLTIGNDAGTANAIRAMGNHHQESGADVIVVDEKHRIVTTAAYMCAVGIGEAGVGIEKLVAKILEMA